MPKLVFLAVALALLGGTRCSRNTQITGPGPIVDLATDIKGLSGLTRDGEGALWAAGENGDAVLRITGQGREIRAYPVLGAPKGTDLEGLAWVRGNEFLVGTETQEEGRGSDVLLGARVEGGKFVVQPRDRIEYEAWGLTAPHNRGMEGLCYADGILVLATELVDERQGKRWAPVATLDVAKGVWSTFWVALSSKTGKLAGVGCRIIDGKVVALAVERHFGVSRLLRFQLPTDSSDASAPPRIEPTVAADLSTVIKPLPNFEGVVWNEDGSVVLLTDNLYKGRSPDPSRLYFVPASVVQ